MIGDWPEKMRPPRREICDCGVLENASKEPGHSIRFDPHLNEYHIAQPNGGCMMVYYCPFCGGRTPDSRRASLFAHVTEAEQQRLCTLHSIRIGVL